MIYSCKDVTLQNRKFSEFIDIDDKELLPDSIDNDSIYLSGYVEGDENNQNIKIKVSQLAEKVATDTNLVNNISEEVIENPETVNYIDKKVKEEIETFIKGSSEEEPSEIEQIIDNAISAKLDEAQYATSKDIENFVSKDDYATEENAGLVKLASATTALSLRTTLTDSDEEEIPSVYTAKDVDGKIDELQVSIDEIDSQVQTNTSDLQGIKELNLNETIKDIEYIKGDIEKLRTLKADQSQITDIQSILGTKTSSTSEDTLWEAIEKNSASIEAINEINSEQGEKISSLETYIDEHATALSQLEATTESHDERLQNLEDEKIPSLETGISDINTRIGTPTENGITIWYKAQEIDAATKENKESIDNLELFVNDHISESGETLNQLLTLCNNTKDNVEKLEEKYENIENLYVTKEELSDKNYATSSDIQQLNEDVSGLTATDIEIKSDINGLKSSVRVTISDIEGLRGNLDGIKASIDSISGNAESAKSISEEARVFASEARDIANSFDEKISSLKIETDKIAAIEQKNSEQDDEIERAKNNAQDAINVANGLEERIIDLDNDINGENGIKVTLAAYENRISNLEELVGTGPIDISSISHIHKLDENATIVAHINNINNEVDALREDVDDHHKLISSHSTRLDELTEAIGGYNDGEEKRPCTSGQQFNQKYEIGEWPNNFSEIKDLWSGLYSIANIVGFDYQDRLPSTPDDRNIITELESKSNQINLNSQHIAELEEKINAFNIAIDTAELFTPGMVSIISSTDDVTYVTEVGTTAVSIDYFERHKPSSFLEDEDEDVRYHRKGTVYVQYKTKNDENEQPIVYSKAAIDSKLDEEYTKKDSGLNYNDDGVTFSLGNNGRDDLPETIEGVAIPMNCPAMCVTKRGIYITVFYGDTGVEQPQGDSRGWRWVQLGTVPQEFVASETRN